MFPYLLPELCSEDGELSIVTDVEADLVGEKHRKGERGKRQSVWKQGPSINKPNEWVGYVPPLTW